MRLHSFHPKFLRFVFIFLLLASSAKLLCYTHLIIEVFEASSNFLQTLVRRHHLQRKEQSTMFTSKNCNVVAWNFLHLFNEICLRMFGTTSMHHLILFETHLLCNLNVMLHYSLQPYCGFMVFLELWCARALEWNGAVKSLGEAQGRNASEHKFKWVQMR